jgi:hypothetical protein
MPFCDNSKGAIRMHGCPRDRGVPGRNFKQEHGLFFVKKEVYQQVVETPPSVNKHTLGIDDAILQVRVQQLRDRITWSVCAECKVFVYLVPLLPVEKEALTIAAMAIGKQGSILCALQGQSVGMKLKV